MASHTVRCHWGITPGPDSRLASSWLSCRGGEAPLEFLCNEGRGAL